METRPTSEEKIMAVIAHLSALAFGMGMGIPAVFWAEQRKKSRYVAFQALQAYGYQSLGYTLWMLAYLAIVVVMLIFLLVAAAFSGSTPNPDAPDALLMVWMFTFLAAAFGLIGLYLLVPVIGAIACALGKDFKYPLLGSRLAKYLGYDFANPEQEINAIHEEQFAAAMGHFTVIIFLWGLFAPLALWLTSGKESLFLRIQSAQTVIYQAVGSLIYLAVSVLATVMFIPLYAGVLLADSGLAGDGITTLVLILFLIGMCLFGLITLFAPLYHILGQWAGLRTLQGHDYRYPLIGRLAEKWFAAAKSSSAQ